MNYSELINKENAFSIFLTQQKRKSEITVHYYRINTNTGVYDFAFIGYATNTEGFHGIHYDRRRNSYYFGTRNKNKNSTLTTLTFNQINEIPILFRTMLLNVSNSKAKISIKKP